MTEDGPPKAVRRKVQPEEVVLAWLDAELDSPRQGATVRGILASHGADVSVVRSADLHDGPQNALRAKVLGDLRGWGAGAMIFEGLATNNLRWFESDLDQTELRRARFMGGGGMEAWDQLAGQGRLVGDAADRVLNNKASSDSKTLQTFRSIAAEVEFSPQAQKHLILLSDAEESEYRVLIEGCHRATGYCLATTSHRRFLVYIGVTPDVVTWGRW